MQSFAHEGICAKISENAGTSYCNNLYAHALEFIRDGNRTERLVFIHVPFMKSISDFNGFSEAVQGAVNMLFKRKPKDNPPEFRYYPDPLRWGDFKNDRAAVCDCCGRETSVYYDGAFYSLHDVQCLCPQCIASGKAAEKFHGAFIDSASCDPVSDDEKVMALCCRTPSYCGWQQECWLACCDDYCAFEGYVGWEEIEKLGLADEIRSTYRRDVCMIDLETVEQQLCRDGSMQGYLFRCLHCGKHHLYVDCD